MVLPSEAWIKGDRRAVTLGIACFGRSLEWFLTEAPLALRQHLGRCWEIRRSHGRYPHRQPAYFCNLPEGSRRVQLGSHHSLVRRARRSFGTPQDGGTVGRRERGAESLWARAAGNLHRTWARGRRNPAHQPRLLPGDRRHHRESAISFSSPSGSHRAGSCVDSDSCRTREYGRDVPGLPRHPLGHPSRGLATGGKSGGLIMRLELLGTLILLVVTGAGLDLKT